MKLNNFKQNINTIIEENFKGTIFENNWKVHFGYDCMGIEITNNTIELSITELEQFREEFESEICWVRLNSNKNIMICYDMSSMILNEFEEWSNYDKEWDNYDKFIKGD